METETTETLPKFLNGSTLTLHWDGKCGGRRNTLNLAAIAPEAAERMIQAPHIKQCSRCRPR